MWRPRRLPPTRRRLRILRRSTLRSPERVPLARRRQPPPSSPRRVLPARPRLIRRPRLVRRPVMLLLAAPSQVGRIPPVLLLPLRRPRSPSRVPRRRRPHRGHGRLPLRRLVWLVRPRAWLLRTRTRRQPPRTPEPSPSRVFRSPLRRRSSPVSRPVTPRSRKMSQVRAPLYSLPCRVLWVSPVLRVRSRWSPTRRCRSPRWAPPVVPVRPGCGCPDWTPGR